MASQSERRLFTGDEVSTLLQVSPEQIDWLVSTRQLTPLTLCGMPRFDSRDLDRLIDNYKTTASRRVQ
jgi:hypothetical protein